MGIGHFARGVDGISIDPEPKCNFDSSLSEIDSVEKNVNASSNVPQPCTKTTLRMGSSGGGFAMRVSEDDIESDEDEEEKEDCSQICTKGRRFGLYLSDESDDGFDCEPESFLMRKMSLAENALLYEYEMINEHQTEVKEDIRNQVSDFEAEIIKEIETYRSAIARIEKYGETRKEVERKLDLQYQRRVAIGLDTYLTAVQHENEVKWQLEERKIWREQEEVRRRERAHQNAKTPQEKARSYFEMLAKFRAAEEARKEVERKAAKEAAEKKIV